MRELRPAKKIRMAEQKGKKGEWGRGNKTRPLFERGMAEDWEGGGRERDGCWRRGRGRKPKKKMRIKFTR